MKYEDPSELAAETPIGAAVPSADYIQAISEFFETDPTDLLAELGYYERGQQPGLVEAGTLSE